MSSVITLRVPESLYLQVKKQAKEDGVSVNQYVQMAVAEKLARFEVLLMVEARFSELEYELKATVENREIMFKEWFKEAHGYLDMRSSYLKKQARQGIREGGNSER